MPGARKLDLPCETHGFEAPHQPPGHVHFPPAQSLAGRTRESVMVVVPSFSVGEQKQPTSSLSTDHRSYAIDNPSGEPHY